MEVNRSTTVRRRLKAPRSRVYRALLDPEDVARWKFPDGMRIEVHVFEAKVGGRIRVSLTYEAPGPAGKTAAQTDTYQGRFAELVPDEKVVEVDAFETSDPAMGGEMTITVTLADAEGGTELTAVHEGIPAGVSLADNTLGWTLALDKLAALVEGR